MDEKKQAQWSNYDPYCICRFILRHAWMVLLAALIFLMLVYLLQNLAFTPTYTSSVTFAVTSRSTDGAAAGNIAVTSTVSSKFGELLSSDILRNAAAERLGLESFPAEVTVYAPENTNILSMNVTAATPELAYKCALAIMDCHARYSTTIFASAVLDNINGPTIATVPANNASRTQMLHMSAPIGALVMTALLFWLALKADTIQTPTGAKQQVDGKLLTTVYHERKRISLRDRIRRKKTSLLISSPTCSFYYTETIHQLRVFLERAKEHDGCKVFMVTSCDENEGKSTIAANLALSLAQKHHKVLLLDADIRKPSQMLIFEENAQRGNDLSACLTKGFTKETLLRAIAHDETTHLYKLYTEPLRRKVMESFSAETFRPLLKALREEFSYIILDTPPMNLFADAEVIAEASDAAILVVRQDVVPAISINDAIDSLTETGAKFLGYVLNNVRSFRINAELSGVHSYGYGYGYGYGYSYGYGYGKDKQLKKSSEKEAQSNE